jgi:hypothetical protein
MAIYAVTNGVPVNLVGQTNVVAYTNGANFAWHTQNFNTPLTLPAGDYVLTWHFSGSTSFLAAYDSGGATAYYGSVWGGTFPSTFGTPAATANLKCSIYASYTTA